LLPKGLSYLAKAYAELGQFDSAQRCCEEAKTQIKTTKERRWEAEVRIAGEIGLKSSMPGQPFDTHDAKRTFPSAGRRSGDELWSAVDALTSANNVADLLPVVLVAVYVPAVSPNVPTLHGRDRRERSGRSRFSARISNTQFSGPMVRVLIAPPITHRTAEIFRGRRQIIRPVFRSGRQRNTWSAARCDGG
jgi:hypothetical protein